METMNVLTLFSAVYSASIITNSKVIVLNKYLLNEQMKEGRKEGRGKKNLLLNSVRSLKEQMLYLPSRGRHTPTRSSTGLKTAQKYEINHSLFLNPLKLIQRIQSFLC